ncbi:MAG: complex I NDUFA9 subunit family protein [Chloroflexi bacterium]|nr:complex I NDUFA9 subunit family protein [Chloroflexota bacterium]
MSTVLVTGPSGFVGSYVVPELARHGHHVIALVRDDRAAGKVTARLDADAARAVSFRVGDPVTGKGLSEALAGVDAVVHLAAIPRDRDGGKSLLKVNLGGTRTMLDAAATARVRRFVHLGALGVTDDPDLHYATSKARAERAVRESGLDWTILEPSLLWGPRDGFFNIVADLVRTSPVVVPVPGSGKARFQPLAVADLAICVRMSLEDPRFIGRTIELGGPRYWTYREITREVLAGMRRSRRIVPMPVPLIGAVAGVAELVRLPFPVATDQLRQLKLDNIGPLDGCYRAFGFVPRSMEGQLWYLQAKKRDQDPATAKPAASADGRATA